MWQNLTKKIRQKCWNQYLKPIKACLRWLNNWLKLRLRIITHLCINKSQLSMIMMYFTLQLNMGICYIMKARLNMSLFELRNLKKRKRIIKIKTIITMSFLLMLMTFSLLNQYFARKLHLILKDKDFSCKRIINYRCQLILQKEKCCLSLRILNKSQEYGQYLRTLLGKILVKFQFLYISTSQLILCNAVQDLKSIISCLIKQQSKVIQ